MPGNSCGRAGDAKKMVCSNHGNAAGMDSHAPVVDRDSVRVGTYVESRVVARLHGLCSVQQVPVVPPLPPTRGHRNETLVLENTVRFRKTDATEARKSQAGVLLPRDTPLALASSCTTFADGGWLQRPVKTGEPNDATPAQKCRNALPCQAASPQ